MWGEEQEGGKDSAKGRDGGVIPGLVEEAELRGEVLSTRRCPGAGEGSSPRFRRETRASDGVWDGLRASWPLQP